VPPKPSRRMLSLAVLAGAAMLLPDRPARAAPAASPACASPEHHQFDFWLGDWTVANADGAPAGASSVTRELDGCVIHEHWQGRGASQGYDGQSFNVFEKSSRTWKQSWVDNAGRGMALLQGKYGDEKMILQGEGDSPKGHHRTRITWSRIDSGKVRQLVEFSFDSGGSWNVVFDGRYSRIGK